jgi:hypothetical protein
MFQNSSFHNVHDPNHLEDASVLLSMAYGGGVVPGASTSPTNAGSSEQRSNWEGPSGGILSTEDTTPPVAASTSSSNNDKGETPSRESNFSSGVVDTPARPAAPGAVLPESMGNLTGTINWLSGGTNIQEVNGNSITPSNWPASESSLSPFNLSSLFATSPFGLTNTPSPGVALSNETTAMAIAAAAAAATAAAQGDDQSNNNNNSNIITLNANNGNNMFTPANPFVAAMLSTLAMNDVPETLGNPNPERPLLRLANRDMVIRAGQECPKGSRF